MRKLIALLLGAAALSGAQAQSSDTPAPGDWPRYARDLEGTRYSPLDQINTGNVENLEQAWSYRLRPDGGAALLGGTVPIVVDGVMYLPLGNAVVALDPTDGHEIWRHPVDGTARRAVSYWPGDGAIKPRLFYSTGSKITAIDVATGQLDTTFGQGGSIAIEGTPYQYPPSIYHNVMVIGANTAEMPRGE